ncbi:hypothetical protein GUI12_01930 [Anaplasmataceae bacterium AB001_6]|nr:hypothetical protein GUI12_01930 [Anaplasmataceae bacterium AB001_6]
MKVNLDSTSVLGNYSNDLKSKFNVVSYNVTNADVPGFERVEYYTSVKSNGLNKSFLVDFSDELMLKEMIHSNSELSYHSKKLAINHDISYILGRPESASASINDYPTNINSAIHKMFEAAHSLFSDPDNSGRQLLFREKCTEMTNFFNEAAVKLYRIYNSLTEEINASFKKINSSLSEIHSLNEQMNKGYLKGLALQDAFYKQKLLLEDVAKEISIENHIQENKSVNVSTHEDKYQLLQGSLLSQFTYNNIYDINDNAAEEDFSVTLKTTDKGRDKTLYLQDLGKGNITAMIEMKKEIQVVLDQMNDLTFQLMEHTNAVQNNGIIVPGYETITSNHQYTKLDEVGKDSDLEILLIDKETGNPIQTSPGVYLKPYRINVHDKTIGEFLDDVNKHFASSDNTNHENIKSVRLVNKGLAGDKLNLNMEVDNQSDESVEISLENIKVKYYDQVNNKYIDISPTALQYEQYKTTLQNEYMELLLDTNMQLDLSALPTQQENIYLEMDIYYNGETLPIKFKINVAEMGVPRNINKRFDLAPTSPTAGHRMYKDNEQLLFANLVDADGIAISPNNVAGCIQMKTVNEFHGIYIREIQHNDNQEGFLTEGEFFNLFKRTNDLLRHTAKSVYFTDLNLHNTLLEERDGINYDIAISDNRNIGQFLQLKFRNIQFQTVEQTFNDFSIDILNASSLKISTQETTSETHHRYNTLITEDYRNITGVSLPDERAKAEEIRQRVDLVNEVLKQNIEIQKSILRLFN